jgi:hypothetical protein
MKFKKLCIFFIILIVNIFYAKYSFCDNKNKYLNEALLEISNETNRQTPMMVDPETRLDMTLVYGNTITIKYTMIKLNRNNIDKNLFRDKLIERQKEYQCNKDSALFLLNCGAKYDLKYFDKYNLLITEFIFDKSNCR